MDSSADDPILDEQLLTAARSALSELKRNIEEQEFWLRKTSGLDLVLGAHLRRAVMALESTMLLAESGVGHDAVVTARVVLEHGLSAASIAMADDPEHEAYVFIIRQWRHVRDADERLREHYPELATPDEKTIASLEKLIWQIDAESSERLARIVKRLDDEHSPDNHMFSWFYDVPYNAMSNYVHARALGLRSVVPPLGEPLRFVEITESQLAINAVRQGMIGLLTIMIACQHAWGTAATEDKLLGPLERFVKRAGPAGEVRVYQL